MMVNLAVGVLKCLPRCILVWLTNLIFQTTDNVPNHCINAQQTNYVCERFSLVRLSEIKVEIQLGVNMLVLLPRSFVILC